MSWLMTSLAFVVAAWLTRQFAHPGSRFHVLDHPNERSLHARPTPRTGGVAMVMAMVASVTVLLLSGAGGVSGPLPWVGAAALVVAGVSYLDDRRNISAGYRFVAHAVAGALVVAGGLGVEVLRLPGINDSLPVWAAVPATVLFVMWMTNLYNFMDGMDGFAGGMAVFGFGVLAILGGRAGDELFASLNLLVAAAAGGFLLLNFPPARIFMGDTGSSTLGFLAAGMALWADKSGIAPLWVSVLVFLPFVSDATVTLVRRALRGERVWEAHRTHFYQRLVRLGWGHRKTVLVEYGLMALCGTAALFAVGSTERVQWGILAAALLLQAAFFGWVCRLEISSGGRPEPG